MKRMFLTLLCTIGLTCHAEQLNYERTTAGNQVLFNYIWQDSQNQRYDLRFAIKKSTLFTPFREFLPFDQTLMDRHILMALRQKAATANPRDVRIEVQQLGSELNMKFRAASQTTIDQWHQALNQQADVARADYLHKHYYVTFETPLQQNLVKPDHVRFALESAEIIQPVINAFRTMLGENASPRDIVTAVASWVQSIPYDTLEDRTTSSGSGFSPPNTLIYENQGDCDSKAVLTAAILHGLLPYVDMMYVFLPEHALLAISIPWQEGEQIITHQALEYVYLEVAGPAVVPIGQLSPSSLRALAQGQQELEPIRFSMAATETQP